MDTLNLPPHQHNIGSELDIFLVFARVIHIIYYPRNSHISLFLPDFGVVSDYAFR